MIFTKGTENAEIILDRRITRALPGQLLHGLEEHPPVTQLRWFTRGWYAVDDEGGEIVMTDLRMGSEPDYVFRFKIARRGTPHPVPIEGEKLPTDMDWERLRWIRERIGRPMPPP